MVAMLGGGGARAWREENESGMRCGGGRWGSPILKGAGGGVVVKVEEWPTLMTQPLVALYSTE
jgi:hypothetical protein